jgi:hypothetical protein
MCSPAIIIQLKKRITRRNLFQEIGISECMTYKGMDLCLKFEI